MTRAAESNGDRPGSGRHRFPASHRLKHRRLIRSLFDRGLDDRLYASAGCIKAVFRLVGREDVPGGASVQVGMFVGRKVGKAFLRNKIRRRMREAYRRAQAPLLRNMETREDALVLGLVFRGSGTESWRTISDDVRSVLKAIEKKSAVGGSPPPPEPLNL